jgi:hypothetical protein
MIVNLVLAALLLFHKMANYNMVVGHFYSDAFNMSDTFRLYQAHFNFLKFEFLQLQPTQRFLHVRFGYLDPRMT